MREAVAIVTAGMLPAGSDGPVAVSACGRAAGQGCRQALQQDGEALAEFLFGRHVPGVFRGFGEQRVIGWRQCGERDGALPAQRAEVLGLQCVTVPPGASTAHLPVAVTVHAVFGVFLLVAGISVLVRAFLGHRRVLILTSAAGLLAIIGATIAGAMFTGNGQADSSMAMAVATGVAQLCYLANVATFHSR
jgi:hypothetical protein